MEPALTHKITTQPRPQCVEPHDDKPDSGVSTRPFDPARLPDDVLITTDKASAWTGHALRTYEKWRAEGRGPRFLRCEGSIRYRVGDIRAWLESVS